ncbi:MAG: P63C domain-containing protein [Hyphomonadaceae bacterium]
MMDKKKQSKGGKARASKLSPQRRSEIAKRAADSRWTANLPESDFEGEFSIGDRTISAAVLRDERRIITQASFLKALGRSRSPKAGTGVLSTVDELPVFLSAKSLKPFINNDLILSTKPVFYKTRSGGKGVGYEASVLRQVADVYLRYRDFCIHQKGGIPVRYQRMIAAAEVIKNALADVGIAAMVDEATGYQAVRNRFALQEVLDAVLAKELAAWAKRFPDEFYRQIFRLRGWEWKGRHVNPPQVVGKYTNNFIYDRITPGLRKELENKMPKTEAGNRKGKLHQLLSGDIGHPMLAQHVHMVTMFMKAAGTWEEFTTNLDKVAPRLGDTYELPLADDV